MPDKDVDTIREDGNCLCWSTEKEILTWIVNNIPQLEYDQQLIILRDPAGYEVKIENTRKDSMTEKNED
jgi:hypothetical protein